MSCHFYIKTIILPRQARDKYRESTQKESGVFVIAAAAAAPIGLVGKGIVYDTVRKTPFGAVFELKQPNIYQDRLGTNVGIVEKKGIVGRAGSASRGTAEG